MKTKDKYDEAIEWLTEHPEHVMQAWYQREGATQHRAHCLFQRTNRLPQHPVCGCLTQIRRNPNLHRAPNNDLTEDIYNDTRIPSSVLDITIAHLPVFAEWQRRLDREFGGKEGVK
jgi:hypothetical protein